jgi:tetratricopeptide (TPR) repeat protein
MDIAYTLDELARVERLTGSYAEAISLLERCLELCPIDVVSERATAHRELGLCKQGLGEGVAAEDHFRKAIDLFKRCEKSVDVAATHRMLGDLLLEKGEGEAGYESYRTGILALERTL